MASAAKATVTPAGTSIRLVRRDSHGLKGTKRNMDHHADGVEVMVSTIAEAVRGIPFKEWVQGHNVHTLITKDNRQYRFRPLHDGAKYMGLELFQVLPGGKRVTIMQVTQVVDIAVVVGLLQVLARSVVKNVAYQPGTERMH